jgi:purine-cytosine permease-like protein
VTGESSVAESDAVNSKDRVGKIEQFGVEYIPEEDRHSGPRNIRAILFGGSLTFSLIIIGWFPISFGLSWWQAATSVVVGSAFGAALLAPMGLMGPRTGTNNPVSSGAYFGVAGRLIGSVLEATASLAFAALSIWTGGDALAGALQAFFGLENSLVPRLFAYGVLSVIVTVVSILGHANMVAAQRFMLPTAGLVMVVGLFIYGRNFDASYAGTGSYALGSVQATWVLSALICGSTVASYGAYAGDWTRHISTRLHTNGSIVRSLFLGGLFGMGGPFMWGTFTSASMFSAGTADAGTPYVLGLVDAAPLWFVPGLIYMGLASGTAQAVINTYGTGLDTSAIIPKLNRVQATLLACVLSAALVYLGEFNTGIEAGVSVFLTVLASFSIPWIVMVTIGHFRRRGWYDVDALQVFNRGEKGGMYWFRHGFNVPAMTVWSLSAVAGLLFSANTWFVGPGATALGGIDIGFLVAGAVAAVLYPLSLRLFPEPREVFGPSSAADPVARPIVPTQPPVPPTTAGEAELV